MPPQVQWKCERLDVVQRRATVQQPGWAQILLGLLARDSNPEPFSGNASDSMSYSNGRQFSSRDVDRDGKAGGSCATQLAGGWWFNYCSFSNLNGPYYRPEYYRAGSTGFALFWRHWKGW
uniref:Fibrinogen C-terminal domain-containing protein n=1 Tax=Branchiostoma floridae TaxID=7739 RepID=C3ZK07_BRAFL|eukprot:XP_002591094.1 hypothetical protein BRAFLDRAFT_108703 [Branchiostoma floridae]